MHPLSQKFSYVHLSAGDLLREERNTPGSAYGELIENHIRNGTIVPVEITCSLLAKVSPIEAICGVHSIDSSGISRQWRRVAKTSS